MPRLRVWEVHIQGKVPQELVPNGEVDPDGSRDFVQKGQKSSGELTALKGAWLVREGAVGNVPSGNALAAYFTLLVRIALTDHKPPEKTMLYLFVRKLSTGQRTLKSFI